MILFEKLNEAEMLHLIYLLAGIAIFFAGIKIKQLFDRFRFKHDQLRQLNLLEIKEHIYHDSKKGVVIKREKLLRPKIYWRKNKSQLVFENYKKTASVHDFENAKDKLEHLYLNPNESFFEIRSESKFFWFQQKRIILFKSTVDLNPEEYKAPNKLEFYKARLGRSINNANQNVEIDFRRNPFLKLIGPTGSSKTNLSLSILNDLTAHEKAQNLRIIFVSAKPEEHTELPFRNFKFLSGFDLEELERTLLDLEKKVLESKKILTDQKIRVSHFIDSEVQIPFQPTVLVLDDCAVYLKIENYVDKDKKETAKRINSKLNEMSNYFRSAGLIILASVQSPLETDVEIGRNYSRIFARPKNLKSAESINPKLIDPVLKIQGVFYFEDNDVFFKSFKV
jgi:energy-coupling factor transporter ATP-binding protein EcfA2